MENRINIAELLKDCPKGMELDCTIYDNVEFEGISDNKDWPIAISVEGYPEVLNPYGCISYRDYTKCVIFPKGKTTWEGFHRPFKDGDIIYNRLQKKICIYYLCGDEVPRIKGCRYNESNTQLQFEKLEYPIPIVIQDYRFATEEEKARLFDAINTNGYKWNADTKTLEKAAKLIFNNGDIVATTSGAWIGITTGGESGELIPTYCVIKSNGTFEAYTDVKKTWCFSRFATKEERQKLFDKIKEHGYIWDSEKKALEKIFPYNIGTKVWVKSDKEHKYLHTIVGISRNSFGNLEYEIKEEKTGIVVHYPKELLIPITKEPKFKVGNVVQDKAGYMVKITEVNIEDECYGYESIIAKGIGGIAFREQVNWELVPNKFNINTLIPFESKVLVRHNKDNKWTGSFFSFIDRDLHSHCYKFVTTADKSYPMMIPFKGNEYLLGKTDDCQDFYKIWE